LFARKWMELESIRLSNVSQAHEDKSCMFYSYVKAIHKRVHKCIHDLR
jgi:hypothetical protein